MLYFSLFFHRIIHVYAGKIYPKGADSMKIYPEPHRKKQEFDPEDYMNSGSAMDCTGLIPAAAQNADELENYEALYDFLPEAAKRSDN